VRLFTASSNGFLQENLTAISAVLNPDPMVLHRFLNFHDTICVWLPLPENVKHIWHGWYNRYYYQWSNRL
jgi:hypothetical protein